MEDLTAPITLKASRSGHIVPVINSISMHSLYAPIHEAEEFIEQHLRAIKTNPNIMVLGLGMGYHIECLLNEISKYHSQYNIVVVEPNKQMIRLYLDNGHQAVPNLEILSGPIEKLYKNKVFVDFLLRRPHIVKHQPSFELYKSFYNSLLTYQASAHCLDIAELIEDEDIKNKLKYFGDRSFREVTNQLLSSNDDLDRTERILVITELIEQSNML